MGPYTRKAWSLSTGVVIRLWLAASESSRQCRLSFVHSDVEFLARPQQKVAKTRLSLLSFVSVGMDVHEIYILSFWLKFG